jgi:hypothetical protein
MLTVLEHIGAENNIKIAKLAVIHPATWMSGYGDMVKEPFNLMLKAMLGYDYVTLVNIHLRNIQKSHLRTAFIFANDDNRRPSAVVTHYMAWYMESAPLASYDQQMAACADRIRACFTTYEIEQMCARYESK